MFKWLIGRKDNSLSTRLHDAAAATIRQEEDAHRQAVNAQKQQQAIIANAVKERHEQIHRRCLKHFSQLSVLKEMEEVFTRHAARNPKDKSLDCTPYCEQEAIQNGILQGRLDSDKNFIGDESDRQVVINAAITAIQPHFRKQKVAIKPGTFYHEAEYYSYGGEGDTRHSGWQTRSRSGIKVIW